MTVFEGLEGDFFQRKTDKMELHVIFKTVTLFKAMPSVPKLLRNELVFKKMRYITASEISKLSEIRVQKAFKSPVRSKGMLMVVSKRWFEFFPEIEFRYPLFTSI